MSDHTSENKEEGETKYSSYNCTASPWSRETFLEWREKNLTITMVGRGKVKKKHQQQPPINLWNMAVILLCLTVGSNRSDRVSLNDFSSRGAGAVSYLSQHTLNIRSKHPKCFSGWRGREYCWLAESVTWAQSDWAEDQTLSIHKRWLTRHSISREDI